MQGNPVGVSVAGGGVDALSPTGLLRNMMGLQSLKQGYSFLFFVFARNFKKKHFLLLSL